MKRHSGGLGSFLNEVTQTADKGESTQVAEQIVYIDIDDLEANPKNFYGLRDVDALAGLISVSHLVEPLTVRKQSNGKYMIISGHRRRAAVQKLLDEGDYTERKLPCIVKTHGKIKIEQEDGEVVEFDEDAVEMLNLIASNRGQREERTIDEKLQEVKYLETFAKAIYYQKNRGRRGRFRSFFAEEILNISKSQLQRIGTLEKLTDKVKAAVDDNTISESAALVMTNMTAEEQDACIEIILSGKISGTAESIQKWRDRRKVAERDDQKYYDRLDIIFKHSKTIYPEESDEILFNDEKFTKKEFGDHIKAAEAWFNKTCLNFYERLLEFLNQVAEASKEENDLAKAEQYEARASIVRMHLEKFKAEKGFK